MVKNITSYQYPWRKSKFKKIIDRVWLKRRSDKKSQQIAWIKYSVKSNLTANWFSKDPERWKKFSKEYQEEFEHKIKLMDEIRDRKKENELLYLINTLEDSDFYINEL